MPKENVPARPAGARPPRHDDTSQKCLKQNTKTASAPAAKPQRRNIMPRKSYIAEMVARAIDDEEKAGTSRRDLRLCRLRSARGDCGRI